MSEYKKGVFLSEGRKKAFLFFVMNVKINKKTIGFKAAGGICKPDEAVEYALLAQKNMGDEYVNNQTFRIGASSLTDSLYVAL